MSVAKSSTATKPIGPRFTESELKKLDAQRTHLGGVSRAGAVKLLWAHMGDDALDRLQRIESATECNERSIEDGAVAQAVGDLTDELPKLEAAFDRYTHQRRAIGVHTNQVAKLANVLRLMICDGRGSQVTPDLVESLTAALETVRNELEEQTAIESDDDRLRSEIRDLIKVSNRELDRGRL